MILFIVFIITSLLLYIFYDYTVSRLKNLPPGPPRLPVWGSYWILLAGNYKFPHLTVEWFSKFYKSKILGFYLGPFYTVATLDHETTHEMLTRPEFEGRLDTFVTRFRAFEKRLGIFFVDGSFWHEQRRFSLRHMRDFGFGRRSQDLESAIEEELHILVNSLRDGPQHEADKELFDKKNHCLLPDALYPGLLNALWFVLAGDKFTPDERRKQMDIVQAAWDFLRNVDPAGGALTMTPWLRYFLPNFIGYNLAKSSSQVLIDTATEALTEHLKYYSEDMDRDFIDRYIRALKEQNEDLTTFTEEQIIMLIADFLIPPATANSSILSFIIMHLVHEPELQQKIQTEIDHVVGRGRLPTLDDRQMMPLTESTVREGMRRETLNPFGIARKALVDTTLGGYFIPKGTMMLPGLWSVHMDEKLWGDPFNFRPERFMDNDGKLLKRDWSIPFGAGKRLCAGETFARQNMFLFLSALLQNFTFTAADGESKPDLNYQTFISGINVSPPSFRVQAVPR